LFFNDFADGFAGAVACIRFDADEYGVIALVFGLEFGGELEAVGGHHAVVVVGGGDHGGRVADAGLEVVEGRVLDEVGEVLGLIAGAVLGYPAFADGKLVVAEHVHDAYGREGHGEEVGALGHAGAYEEAAVATAGDGEFFFVSVALLDEVLAGGDEVVEDVLFFEQHTGLMPFFAVFAAAAEVGHGKDAAIFEQYQAGSAEAGREADVEAAVAVQVGGVGAVELKALAVYDEHTDFSTVFAGVEDLLLDVILGIELELGGKERLRFAGFYVVLEDGSRIDEGSEGVEEGLFVFLAGEAAGRAEAGELDFLLAGAVVIVAEVAIGGIFEVVGVEVAAAGGYALKEVIGLGDDGFPVGFSGIFEVYFHEAILGRVDVGEYQHAIADVVHYATFVGKAFEELDEVAAFLKVFVVGGKAVGARLGVEDEVALVFGDAGAVVHIGVFVVAVDELIFRLVVADAVIVYRVVLVVSGELGAFGGLGVAAVVEAVALPGSAAEFDPFEAVGQLSLGSYFHDTDFLPVAAGIGAGIGGVFIVVGEPDEGDGRSAFFGEGVGVDEYFRFAGQALLYIDDGLVLEAVVFVEEVVLAGAHGAGIARVVDELRDAILNILAEGYLIEVAEGSFILGLHPGGNVLSGIVFEPAIRIAYKRTMIVVAMVDLFGIGVSHFHFRISGIGC